VRRADPPSKESYLLLEKDYETEEEARAQQKAVEPWMDELMNGRKSLLMRSGYVTLVFFCFVLRCHWLLYVASHDGNID
jgi:hypothetical protein